MARSASWSASRWTMSISFWSSPSLIGWFGFLRSSEWVVVKTLTTSTALQMTTLSGKTLDQRTGDADDARRRAEAGHLLGFLERDRAIVHDCRDIGHGSRLHVG